MSVVTYCNHLLQDRKSLYQFLSTCQQKSIERYHPQIASISVEIDPVDPLAVLHEMAEPDQPHFYFEKGYEGEAIAAIGAAVHSEIAGVQRFSEAQELINSCFDHLMISESSNLLTTPRFFCSFTFFDQAQRSNSFPAATLFLPQWQVLCRQGNCVVTANSAIHPSSDIETLVETIWGKFQTIRLIKYGIFNLHDGIRSKLNKWDVIDTCKFKPAVVSALESIRTNHLNKLVLAHAIDVISRFPFQPIHSLHNLRKLHSDCYVFSTSSGRGQSFIGASPERLLSIRNRRLVTDALAGSAPRGKTLGEDADLANQLLGSEKERREHQVVVDFITQQLAQFGLSPELAAVPGLLQLSNIQHLHTPIQAIVPVDIHPLEILAELHPTPAVAGMPTDVACEQIRRYESFERSLYAAPLGWLDYEGNAEFIVGIRSALIEGCHARLYAGAGIVAGSDPDKELAEVKLKLQALLQALV